MILITAANISLDHTRTSFLYDTLCNLHQTLPCFGGSYCHINYNSPVPCARKVYIVDYKNHLYSICSACSANLDDYEDLI